MRLWSLGSAAGVCAGVFICAAAEAWASCCCGSRAPLRGLKWGVGRGGEGLRWMTANGKARRVTVGEIFSDLLPLLVSAVCRQVTGLADVGDHCFSSSFLAMSVYLPSHVCVP